jgi:predicted methyltransferase
MRVWGFGALILAACAPAPHQEPAAPAGPPAPVASVIVEPPAAQSEPAVPDFIARAVAAPDRPDSDRALDAGRHPGETLAFFGIRPGQRVAELGAGGGYTTELLARVVGAGGKVYGQNSRFILERFAEKPWTERLTHPALANVVRLDREFDDPLPNDVHDLDAVIVVLFYHDTVWMKVDRDKMNRAVYAALAPGGLYGIVDHSARPGTGSSDVETLHRIEEKVVVEEVERAGFKLEKRGDFLKNPQDARDWNASPRKAAERRGTSDRFVLAFRKP